MTLTKLPPDGTARTKVPYYEQIPGRKAEAGTARVSSLVSAYVHAIESGTGGPPLAVMREHDIADSEPVSGSARDNPPVGKSQYAPPPDCPYGAEAGTLLRRALVKYRRPDSYEGHLVQAADQLVELGRAGWVALCGLANQRVPECEFFVRAIVAARGFGVPLAEKRAALLDLAANPSLNTRSRLLEYVDDLPPAVRKEVMRQLIDESQPADDVTYRARELAQERP